VASSREFFEKDEGKRKEVEVLSSRLTTSGEGRRTEVRGKSCSGSIIFWRKRKKRPE